MSEDRRDALIRDAIRSFNEMDIDGLMSFIHPEVTARVGEGLGNPGTYQGVEGFGVMMEAWSEAWAEQEISLREIEHVSEDVSLVHCHQSLVGAASGVPVEIGTTFLVVFGSEQAIRFEIHGSREAAMEAL